MAIFEFDSVKSAGGAGFKLAPDLKFPTNITAALNTGPIIAIGGINASAGLTTALSLSGKFVVSLLTFTNLTAENLTFKLTVDGFVIWNDTTTVTSANQTLLGQSPGTPTNGGSDIPIICESSLLLEVQTTTDTDIELRYLARPIL